MAAPTSNSEKQLAWEARHRTRAGIAAIIGALGLFALLRARADRRRAASRTRAGCESLVRAVQPGPHRRRCRRCRVPYWEYIDEQGRPAAAPRGLRAARLHRAGLGGGLPGRRHARPRARRSAAVLIYFPIVGGVVTGIGVLLSQIGHAHGRSTTSSPGRARSGGRAGPRQRPGRLRAACSRRSGRSCSPSGWCSSRNYAMRAGLLTQAVRLHRHPRAARCWSSARCRSCTRSGSAARHALPRPLAGRRSARLENG